MSADNWTVCPNCKKEHKAEHDKLSILINESYGKISLSDYNNLVEKLRKNEIDSTNFTCTLREDYDIGIVEGVFAVTFRAQCAICGFKYSYDYGEMTVKNE